MKLVNIPNYIDIKLINYINGIIEAISESDFNEERFNEWLIEVDVESKKNPSAYIKACFKKELEAGTFRPKPKVEYIPNTQEIINELRNRGVCVLADESMWLYVLWCYLLNEKKLDEKTCRNLNRQIIGYMTSKGFAEYKELIMKSKTLQPLNIDWNFIDKKTQAEIIKWNDLLDSLESEE